MFTVTILVTIIVILGSLYLRKKYIEKKKAEYIKNMFPPKVIPEKCYKYKFPGKGKVLTKLRAIMFSLSIGFSKDPVKLNDLKFTYEKHKQFEIFPTIITAFPHINIIARLTYCDGLPVF